MNAVKIFCGGLALFAWAQVFGATTIVPNYIMVGLHTNRQGSLHRSLDFGRTWQQRWCGGIQVNYGLAVGADGRVYYRDQRQVMKTCPAHPDEDNKGCESGCDERCKNCKAASAAADAYGHVYYVGIDNENNVLLGSNYGSDRWRVCGDRRVSFAPKAVAPINDWGLYFIAKDERSVQLLNLKNCDQKSVYEGQSVEAIAACPGTGDLLLISGGRLYRRLFSNGEIKQVGVDFTDVAVAPDRTVYALKGDKELWTCGLDCNDGWKLVASNLPVDHIAIHPLFSGTVTQDCNALCDQFLSAKNGDYGITNKACKQYCGNSDFIMPSTLENPINLLNLSYGQAHNTYKLLVSAISKINGAMNDTAKVKAAIENQEKINTEYESSLKQCGASAVCDGSSDEPKNYTPPPANFVPAKGIACKNCSLATLADQIAWATAYANYEGQGYVFDEKKDELDAVLDEVLSKAGAKTGALEKLINKGACLDEALSTCVEGSM